MGQFHTFFDVRRPGSRLKVFEDYIYILYIILYNIIYIYILYNIIYINNLWWPLSRHLVITSLVLINHNPQLHPQVSCEQHGMSIGNMLMNL
jgi:hypothetical protein